MKSAFFELADQFPDTKRHPLVAESADWEQIAPVLIEFTKAVSVSGINEDFANWLRILAEVVYVMGYERGKRERGFAFRVAEEGA